MRVSTVRLAIPLGLALAVGGALGQQAERYADGGDYGLYLGSVGVEYADGAVTAWACPEWAPTINCPVDFTPGSIRQAGEDTRDGQPLTDAMVEELYLRNPETDPRACRAHPVSDLTLVITCDDGTQIVWSS